MTLLADAARKCVATHRPAAGWHVELTMETTWDEVVDVVPGTGGSLPIAACLVEAVWAVQLTAAYDLERETFALAFR
jgi:hypothetical protein